KSVPRNHGSTPPPALRPLCGPLQDGMCVPVEHVRPTHQSNFQTKAAQNTGSAGHSRSCSLAWQRIDRALTRKKTVPVAEYPGHWEKIWEAHLSWTRISCVD